MLLRQVEGLLGDSEYSWLWPTLSNTLKLFADPCGFLGIMVSLFANGCSLELWFFFVLELPVVLLGHMETTEVCVSPSRLFSSLLCLAPLSAPTLAPAALLWEPAQVS